MIRSLVASLSAAALVLTTSASAFAQSSMSGPGSSPMMHYADSWRYGYAGSSDTLSGVLDENESAGMAYLTIPFGGVGVKKGEPRFGFSITTRLPDEWSRAGIGGRAGMAEVFDISWTPSGASDWRLSGVSFNQMERRLNAVDEEVSGFWTYGLMLAAAGVAAALVVFSKGDAATFPPEEDPMDGGDAGDGSDGGDGGGT